LFAIFCEGRHAIRNAAAGDRLDASSTAPPDTPPELPPGSTRPATGTAAPVGESPSVPVAWRWRRR